MSSSQLSLSLPENPDFLLSSLTFESCLGQGGFGIVLKALDINPTPSSTPTALKFIFPSDSNEKEQRQILRECELAATFTHPNIVRILGVTRNQLNADEIEDIFKNLDPDDERSLTLRDTYVAKAKRHKTKTLEFICIRMELCGGNLRTWLQLEHPKDDKEFQILQIKICSGLASGIQYLHDHKTIHRDLKPENVLFSNPGYTLPVKIGDFGLCRVLHSPESYTNTLTSRVGTGDYMAPEVFSNAYSFQADLYSLGLIFWEVFQLIPSPERKSLFHRLVADKEADLVNISQLSAFSPIGKLIVNMTQSKIQDRIQSVTQVVQSLRDWSQNPGCVAGTSEELATYLKNVEPGGRIILSEGVFQGQFILGKDNVEIVGQGDGKTVLRGLPDKTSLFVMASGCTISGLKVILREGGKSAGIDLQGSKNIIQNLQVSSSGDGSCIDVSGDANKLQSLSMSNAKDGIYIGEGNNILIDKLKLENITGSGIYLDSHCNHSTISHVTGSNVKHGIEVGGSNNDLSHIQLTKGREEERGCYGVRLYSGSSNTISHLNTIGYSRAKGDWGLFMGCSDSSVKDCPSGCGPIEVAGSRVTLTNVDWGEVIHITRAAHGITLIGCRGQSSVVDGTEVITQNCTITY